MILKKWVKKYYLYLIKKSLKKIKMQIINFDDPSWNQTLNKLEENYQDIFYRQEFAQLTQNSIYLKYNIKCAIMNYNGGVLLYPFILRKFNFEGIEEFYDITSLYGRGGIITNIKNDNILNHFFDEFNTYCIKKKIVTSLDRFHPIIKNDKFIHQKTEVIDVGNFSWVDLSNNIEDLKNRLADRHKKSLKKAQNNNIKIFFESNLEHLDDFLNIYSISMERKNADKFYYFNKKFYNMLDIFLKNNYTFFYATYKNKIISCELILHNKFYSHSYLGSTLHEYKHLCANHLLKFEIIKYSKNQKNKFFLLGGGIKANDGICKYKSGFSSTNCKSLIGKTIFNKEKYLEVDNYFLKKKIKKIDKFQFYENN